MQLDVRLGKMNSNDLYIIKLPTANGLVFKTNNRYSNEGSMKRHNKNTVAEYFQMYTNPFHRAIIGYFFKI